MKTTFLALVFAAFVLTNNAQVTLDKKYDYSTTVVHLENSGYKYYLMDVPTGQCRIYNTDHSLFKTVNCNIPSGFFLSDIKFVSENIFDNDAGIELLCTFYKYYSAQLYYEYDSKIINEDGSQLTFIDGSLYNYINQTGENTWKLFSYCYDYSVFPEKVWTNIFNLPATAVSAQYLIKSQEIILNAFPNPASETINVTYSLPENVQLGTLHLYDASGKQVEKFKVDNHTDHLTLDVSRFKSGVYLYFIEYGNTKTPSQKLVIK